ncbi:hypothetical protein [Streptomyces sp. NPDC088785]|uniref:hypothetical protein n=1 Tax=Streptomyces sp. NPDC088785 TaxID=3365897 RepID=UPI0037FD9CD7
MVDEAATGIAHALRDEGGSSSCPYSFPQAGDPLAAMAVRLLGADALAPFAVDHGPAANETDAALVRQALTDYPPDADSSTVVEWSYHGLAEAAQARLPSPATTATATGAPTPHHPPSTLPPPDAQWTHSDPWPQLSYRVSQLAALAAPGLAAGLQEHLAPRTDDLARGFVRAVRRRDWLQAIGIGRWLARLPDVPDSLGLDTGLAFVRHMAGDHPRVALHSAATQRFFGRG